MDRFWEGVAAVIVIGIIFIAMVLAMQLGMAAIDWLQAHHLFA